MRILIGNDIDPNLLKKADIRSWSQRVLWFAQNGDLVILLSPPDPVFLHRVALLNNVDISTLKIHVLPGGRFEGRRFDPLTLVDKSFVQAVSRDIKGVERIIALWPSSQITEFAAALNLEQAWSGSAFFSQGGGATCGSKANFRAFAAGIGVPIAEGLVCLSKDEALAGTINLLKKYPAIMVKQEYPCAGAGNQFVTRDPTISASMAGAKYTWRLESGLDSVDEYWNRHWEWASSGGKCRVVLEEFKQDATTIYAEFHCGDNGVELGGTGKLIYSGGALVEEIVPLQDIPSSSYAVLIEQGSRLADFYRALGYRGPLSADAVMTRDGAIAFTEANAHFTCSTHLYKVIEQQIVRAKQPPSRIVTQLASPWLVANLETFEIAVRELGLEYDRASRTGIIPSWPVVQTEVGGRMLFCVISENSEDKLRMISALAAKLAPAAA